MVKKGTTVDGRKDSVEISRILTAVSENNLQSIKNIELKCSMSSYVENQILCISLSTIKKIEINNWTYLLTDNITDMRRDSSNPGFNFSDLNRVLKVSFKNPG